MVSTPIGNLADISLRALAVLQGVSAVCCEDTRHSRVLLERHGIATPTLALHEHNEARATPALLARLAAGEALALVSDAGTPLLSDPGARLVAAAIAAGHPVVPVPGASAALAALVASGLPALPCTLLGFLPRRGAERREAVRTAAEAPHTVVLYEAPPRLADTLAELAAAAGDDREVVVARELTKRFEEFRRGTLGALATYYRQQPPRGELVVVLAGRPAPPAGADEPALRDAAAAMRAEGFRPRAIAEQLVGVHGAARNLAYRIAHES